MSYVKSLEQRVAELESRLGSQEPSTVENSFPVDGTQRWSHSLADDLQPMDPMHWQYSFYSSMANPPDPHNAFEHLLVDPNAIHSLSTRVSVNSGLADKTPVSTHDHDFFALEPVAESSHKNDEPLPGLPIPCAEIASFLHAYFELIHPRYPFLDIDECANAYLKHKQTLSVTDEVQASWYSFLLTTVSQSIHPPA